MAALPTEFIAREDFGTTLRAGKRKLCPALTAKPLLFRVYRLAFSALHLMPPGEIKDKTFRRKGMGLTFMRMKFIKDAPHCQFQ
ncbi:MAG: hypothetical protein AMK69_15515 [Nitrospira bacterium SG8_3]|nr:MAG: hypothetical protein AMK69_15515 [Nitrospira bacterium SG8_3]